MFELDLNVLWPSEFNGGNLLHGQGVPWNSEDNSKMHADQDGVL